MKRSDNGQQVRMAARFDDLSMSPRTELVIASARNLPPAACLRTSLIITSGLGQYFLTSAFAQTTEVAILAALETL